MDDDIWLDDEDDDSGNRRKSPQQPPASWDRPLRSEQKKTISPALIGAMVIGCVISLSAIGMIAYVAFDRLAGVTVAGRRSQATLNSESNRIFSEFDSQDPLKNLPPDEQPIHDKILDLLSRLEKFSESPAPAAVADIVDLKRMAERVELTGGLADWNYVDKVQLRSQLVDFVVDDIEPGNITLAGFARVADDPLTRVAYVWVVDPQSREETEIRLWLAPAKDGQWKLYDWARLDIGMAESEEVGIYCRYHESNRLDSYYALSDHLVQADGLIEERDYAAAAKQLKLAESTAVVTEFVDFCHLLTAYRWQQMNDYKNARACFERIRHPEQTPGAFFGLMNCAEYDDPEFALQNAIHYEKCIGPGVDLCSRKARLLERLERHEEAMLDWQKVLRIDAGNAGALVALLKNFADDRKRELSPYLERTDDPVATAISLVNYRSVEDRSGRAFLIDFISSRESDSGRAEAAVAQSLWIDGQLKQAAEHYEAAMKQEQNDDDREQYASSYLDMMTNLGRVLEALDRVPVKEDAYDYLIYSEDEGDIILSSEEYQEITRRYLDEFPSNGWAVYYRAAALSRIDKSAEALDLLQNYLDSADRKLDEEDDYLDSSIQSLIVSTQLEAGSDVVKLLNESPASLSTLGASAAADERWTDVAALIAAGKSISADEIDLLRLQGRLAIHEQRWDDAISVGLAANELVKNDPQKSHMSWEFNRLLQTAHLNSDQWDRYYDGQADKRQVFGALARELMTRRDWSTFQKLADKHRRILPTDPQLPQWLSETQWFQSDYRACTRSCEDALKMAKDDSDHQISDWQLSQLRDRRLACLLQRKQYSEAKRIAQQSLKEEQNPVPLAIVAAARKDVAETRRSALEAFEQTETLLDLYQHPQAAKFILGEEFADIHERSPVDISYIEEADESEKAVFLFDTPPSLDAQTISKLLKEIAPKERAVVEEFQSRGTDVTTAFVVRTPNSYIHLVSVGRKDYDWELVKPAPQIASIIEANTDWLTISTGSLNGHEDQDSPLVRKLALRLAADAKGVIIFSNWSWRFVEINSAGLNDWARTGYLPSAQFPKVHPQTDTSDTVQATREFEQNLRELAMSWSAEPPSGLEVQCQFGSPQLGESIWIEVQSAKHVSYGNCEFDGVVKSTSRLLPMIRAGLKVTIAQWNVEAWRHSDGQVHVHPDHPRFTSSQE